MPKMLRMAGTDLVWELEESVDLASRAREIATARASNQFLPLRARLPGQAEFAYVTLVPGTPVAHAGPSSRGSSRGGRWARRTSRARWTGAGEHVLGDQVGRPVDEVVRLAVVERREPCTGRASRSSAAASSGSCASRDRPARRAGTSRAPPFRPRWPPARVAWSTGPPAPRRRTGCGWPT